MIKDEQILNEMKHFVPLNDNGEEMSYEELDKYVKSQPISEGKNRIEDAAFYIEGDLEDFILIKGGVPIEKYLSRFNISDEG